MKQILHENFTSAFSLVYWINLDMKNLPIIMKVFQTSTLPFFLFLGNVYAHDFGSMSHFLTLGWQVSISHLIFCLFLINPKKYI